MHAAARQGDLVWEARRSGDPAADWPLLQQVARDNPDVFWGALLGRALRVPLAAPPSRVLCAGDPAQPDGARWLPGARRAAAGARASGGRRAAGGAHARVRCGKAATAQPPHAAASAAAAPTPPPCARAARRCAP
jgi:hypothetical protein